MRPRARTAGVNRRMCHWAVGVKKGASLARRPARWGRSVIGTFRPRPLAVPPPTGDGRSPPTEASSHPQRGPPERPGSTSTSRQAHRTVRVSRRTANRRCVLLLSSRTVTTQSRKTIIFRSFVYYISGDKIFAFHFSAK